MATDTVVVAVDGNGEAAMGESSDRLGTGGDKEDTAALYGPRQSKPNKISKQRTRGKSRRGPRYQTQDLIREKSPQPDQQVMKNAAGHQNREHGDNLQSNSGEIVDKEGPDAGKRSESESNQQPSKLNTLSTSGLNGKRTVQCNICKRQMTESRLANHIRLLHVETTQKNDENTSSSKRKEFRCESCGKCYAVKYTYEQHVKTHIEGRPKCPECGSTFASAFSLFRHRAKVHNIKHNYKTHACDQCDKMYFSLSELNCHKQRHSKEKLHKCQECNKSFAARGNLRIHMRTHAKEKPFKCDMCDSSFSHPYSLVSHRRIHTNEFPFTCDECGKSYRSKHQLTSHKNVHSDGRPFGCDQCTKTFRSRTAFRMHQDTHKGIKRFVCQYCERKFQCNANKIKHERRHLGIKRFKCDKCDKAFIERQELKNHEKVHVKQKSNPKSTKGAKRSVTKAEEPSSKSVACKDGEDDRHDTQDDVSEEAV